MSINNHLFSIANGIDIQHIFQKKQKPHVTTERMLDAVRRGDLYRELEVNDAEHTRPRICGVEFVLETT